MVTALVWRTKFPGSIVGVATFKFRLSLVGGTVADAPRCNPVMLAGQFELPEFTTLHIVVIWSPGRARELLNVTSCGTRFGCGSSRTTESAGECAASSARVI